jgi:hypothetical protein
MDGYYTYQVMSTDTRGVAAVGMYFEQAGVGYIHVPLLEDNPVKIATSDMETFRARLQEFS